MFVIGSIIKQYLRGLAKERSYRKSGTENSLKMIYTCFFFSQQREEEDGSGYLRPYDTKIRSTIHKASYSKLPIRSKDFFCRHPAKA